MTHVLDNSFRPLGRSVIAAAAAALLLTLATGCSWEGDAQAATDFVEEGPKFNDPILQALRTQGALTGLIRESITPDELAFDTRIRRLGDEFGGKVGIAVQEIVTGWTVHYNGGDPFPQQSVSKLWVALSALEKADRGELDLAAPVTLHRGDLTLFHQPLREKVLRSGSYTTTLEELLFLAVTQSDNTANDYLMWQAGGPEAVRATLEKKAIAAIRFGPGERLLQSALAGLEWRPDYSVGRAFYEARERVPATKRREAFEAYIADPIDGAAPVAMVHTLSRLHRGELLSPVSTGRLLATMEQTRSGPRRLKGGLAPGWSIGHKTGTGQELGAEQTGYNDVGIVTSPSGRAYSIAVMIGRTNRPIAQRMELMQTVVKAVVEHEQGLSTQDAVLAAGAGDPSGAIAAR